MRALPGFQLLTILLVAIVAAIVASQTSLPAPPKQNAFEVKNGLNISHWLSQTANRDAQRDFGERLTDTEQCYHLAQKAERIILELNTYWSGIGERH